MQVTLCSKAEALTSAQHCWHCWQHRATYHASSFAWGCRISVILTTRHATHAKGSKRVSAAYKGGCTHGMHGGGGKVDRGAHVRGWRGKVSL